MRPLVPLTSILALTLGCSTTNSPVTAPPDEDHLEASQVCVVRHAEAFKNLVPPPEDLTPEQLDSLTERGIQQARAIAQKLPSGVKLVWSSPAGRAQQTAQQIVEPSAITVRVELRQIDGSMSWDERTAAWARGEDPRPFDGESLADAQLRVQTLLTELAPELAPGQHAVLVTHGDIASLILGELLKTPLLERPTTETLATGQARCLPLR